MKMMKFSALALAIACGAAFIAGCDKKTETEVYAGHFGDKPCTESYKQPVNITRCEQQQGLGGK